MREADAQAVLLVRALEEADADGRVLTAAHRVRASQEARGLFGSTADEPARDEELLVHRARSVLPEVVTAAPGLARLLESGRVGLVLGPVMLVGAAALGLASNALGPSRQINILFAPMLGLVAWNLVVYGLVLVSAVRRRSGHVDEAGSGRERAGGDLRAALSAGRGAVAGLARRLVQRTFRRATAERAEQHAVVAATATRFAHSWGSASAALMASRLTRLAHLCSLLLVVGAVTGMYIRGLGLAYRASWQSTFLDAQQVSSLLHVVLAPASRVLGVPLPDVVALEYPAEGEAAPWIHLWAMTGLLFVALPRCVLWIVERRRTLRLAEGIALDFGQPYYRKLLAPVRGDAAAVDVLPYGVRLSPRSRDSLVELLHDVLGARAEVAVAETLAYGEEASAAQPPSSAVAEPPDPAVPERSVLVVFGLAQSPESEVHGVFVEELLARLNHGSRMAVLIDGAGYRERATDERRLDERRRAWDRVLREAGAPVVHAELDQPLSPETVEQLDVALRPEIPQTAR